MSQVGFDDGAGILSFRYVSEPWSHLLPITTTSVDVNDYDQVIAYLHDQHQHGSTSQRQRAEATLSSGFSDENERYRYVPDVEPWCGGVGGCAVFTLNPDPDIPTNCSAEIFAAMIELPTRYHGRVLEAKKKFAVSLFLFTLTQG